MKFEIKDVLGNWSWVIDECESISDGIKKFNAIIDMICSYDEEYHQQLIIDGKIILEKIYLFDLTI